MLFFTEQSFIIVGTIIYNFNYVGSSQSLCNSSTHHRFCSHLPQREKSRLLHTRLERNKWVVFLENVKGWFHWKL